MARFEGYASIRRVISHPSGEVSLDICPEGLDWQWSIVPPARAREALACGIAAMSSRYKVYISLPDDQNSSVLEIVGLSNATE